MGRWKSWWLLGFGCFGVFALLNQDKKVPGVQLFWGSAQQYGLVVNSTYCSATFETRTLINLYNETFVFDS